MEIRYKIQKILLLSCFLILLSPAYGQKEIWAYKMENAGLLIKAPLAGQDYEPEIMHAFDETGILGKFPKDRLLQASNGKFYGVTAASGNVQGVPPGVLFEYDPVIDRYRILATTVINGSNGPVFGLIEPQSGWLYGTTDGGRSIFKYNIETEAISIAATIPAFVYNGSNLYPQFIGELMKASDGNIYGVTSMAPSSQNIPYPGGIYRFNIITEQLTKIYVFGTNNSDVMYPVFGTRLIEGATGKLYGTALGGEHPGPQGIAPLGSGTLFEFSTATATMVKKYDFDYTTVGADPSPIIKNGNKLYGTLTGNTNNPPNYPNSNGALYEYDLSTEVLSVLHAFNWGNDMVKTPCGILLRAGNGNFYGGSLYGIYEFDPVANTVIKHINTSNAYDMQSPIEVCRKPAYQFFETASFVVCGDSSFSFDIHSSNSESYVWKKGSVTLPSQTTSMLTLSDVTVSDTGIYTCTMTNECGTTVTMPLQLTVEVCMGVDEVSGFREIRLYPNPATATINISLPDAADFEVQQVAVTNMLGQTVYTGSGETMAIDISALNTGVYQIVIVTDKGNWNGRFIKE